MIYCSGQQKLTKSEPKNSGLRGLREIHFFYLFCCSSCDLPMGFFWGGGGGGVGRGFDPPPVHISRITNLILI